MDELINFESGDVIFAEGDKGDCLYIVEKGEVILLKEDGSRLAPVSMIKSGEFLGELSALGSSAQRSATAVAVKPCSVYKIKNQDIQSVLAKCPAWVKDIMLKLSDRLHASMEVMKEHRIMDEELEKFLELYPERILMYKDRVDSYRRNKGVI